LGEPGLITPKQWLERALREVAEGGGYRLVPAPQDSGLKPQASPERTYGGYTLGTLVEMYRRDVENCSIDPDGVCDEVWVLCNAVPALIARIEELEAVVGNLSRACERLLLWPVLHEQEHPEWNGNRFDDQQLAVSAMKEAAKCLKP